MQVSERINAQKKFKLNFNGPVGQYFKKKRESCDSPNSETFHSAADRDVVMPTGRRLKQFLRGAEKITDKYIDLNGENEGRVRISELAEKLGYKIEKCNDLIDKIHEEAKWWYKAALKNAPEDNNSIDGFSIPKKRLIFYKDGIDPEHKNFVIAHELSHYLLRHKGIFFYRDTSIETQLEEKNEANEPIGIISKSSVDSEKPKENKKLHEKIEYSEEADRLAAILLMPYIFMLKFKDKKDEELVKIFQVPLRAIQKRRKEVIKEREKIGFLPSLHTEGVEL